MCAKPGKILSPGGTRALYSLPTLTAGERKRSGYMMNLAIRGTVDDMVGMLESGDKGDNVPDW